MPVFDVSYNGIRASYLKVKVESRPDIPDGEDDIEEIEIPGLDGALHVNNGRKSPIEIAVDMGFREPGGWHARWEEVKKWLREPNGRLEFSDMPGMYYQVYYVRLSEAERTLRKYGKFTPTFVCYPYRYRLDGEMWFPAGQSVLYNAWEIAHPVYQILGEGMCTLTVNGKSMTANVGQNLIVDTERRIAYRQDGELMNTEVTGDYEDLYLQKGENIVTASSGFTVTVQPRWRCR